MASIVLWMYVVDTTDTHYSLVRFGADLRARRRSRGLTQAQLAKRIRLSRSVVIRGERGDPSIAIGNFTELLVATGAELIAGGTRLPTLEEVGALFPDE